jgi:hypothetical protein
MFGKKGLFVGLALTAALVGEGAAHAIAANFQGNCTRSSTSSPTNCEFSPNKAPAGQPFTGCGGAGGVNLYYWLFGDGTWEVTYPTTDFGRADHVYAAGPLNLNIELDVYCNDGRVVSAVHCLNTTPTTGCIIINGGWSPY